MAELVLLGDEAVALGAVHAGLTTASGVVGLTLRACRAGREAAKP